MIPRKVISLLRHYEILIDETHKKKIDYEKLEKIMGSFPNNCLEKNETNNKNSTIDIYISNQYLKYKKELEENRQIILRYTRDKFEARADLLNEIENLVTQVGSDE